MKQQGDSINMTRRPERIWKAPATRQPKSPVITPIIFHRPKSIATEREKMDEEDETLFGCVSILSLLPCKLEHKEQQLLSG